MKDKIKRIFESDRFVVILGLVIVPIISFILITLSDESPLYTSISRLAWINGRWFATFVWALIVMGSIIFLTYRMVKEGPLSIRTKKIYLIAQTVNIILVFIGCIIFPAKAGTEFINFFNYTKLGTIIAMAGANFLDTVKIGLVPLMIIFVLFSA